MGGCAGEICWRRIKLIRYRRTLFIRFRQIHSTHLSQIQWIRRRQIYRRCMRRIKPFHLLRGHYGLAKVGNGLSEDFGLKEEEIESGRVSQLVN